MSWQKVKLGEVVKQIRGVTYSAGDAIENKKDGYVELLRANNINDGKINFDKVIYVPQKKVSANQYIKKNDILICTSSGSLNLVGKAGGLNSERLCTFGAFCKLIRVDEKVNARYIANYFQTIEYKQKISALAEGANINNLRNEHIDNLEIPLPPHAEQQRIASILDKVKLVKSKRELALAKLNELAESAFYEMFGNPLTNPKNWKEVRLNDICNAISDIDHKMPKAVDEGVPFISAKDLQDNDKLSFENVKFISQKDFLHLSRKIKPSKGDIIYSRIGANLGKARLVDVDIDFVVSYSCCTIKPKLEAVNAKYLCKLLDLPATLEQAKKGTHSIAVPDLGIGEIKNFKIMLPPLELQKKYSDFLEKLKRQKNDISTAQKYVNDLLLSLQSQAFSGQL